jgi:S1-C subfamily serine protease
LGGQESNSVSVGRVISLDTKESGTGTSTVKYISSINTDMVSSNLENGSPLFNLSGEIVGIQLSNNSSKSFTPVSVLKKDLSVLQN